MLESLEFSVVRIYRKRETQDAPIEVVGAGFLVSSEYIVTCAHVITTALDLEVRCCDKPTQIIECDFVTIEAGVVLKTTVEVWKPVQLESNEPQDIAILKLKNKDLKPSKAQPIPLIENRDFAREGNSFEALGFPSDDSDGIWADGKIIKVVGYNKIQIQGQTVTGEQLQSGFSGTAIWDKDLAGVIGMAVMEHDNPDAKIAFFIPTDMLIKAFPILLEIATIKGCIPEIIILLKDTCAYQELEYELNCAYKKMVAHLEFNLVSLPQKFIVSNLTSLIYDLQEQRIYLTNELEKFTFLSLFIGYFYCEINPVNLLGKLLRKELKKWLENYVKDWKSLISILKIKCQQSEERIIQKREKISQIDEKKQEPCLLVCISEENNIFRFRSWLIKDLKKYNPIQEEERNYCKSLTATEGEVIKKTQKFEQQIIVDYLKKVYQEALQISGCYLEKIQVFCPYKLIEKQIEPIDLLTIDKIPSSNPPPMGVNYQIAVRFSERLKIIKDRETYLWENKCEHLRKKQREVISEMPDPFVCDFSDIDPRELYT
ncbi:MAG: trypsin-like peptidase domain-containing protein, partial [Crocosphaera sp.]